MIFYSDGQQFRRVWANKISPANGQKLTDKKIDKTILQRTVTMYNDELWEEVRWRWLISDPNNKIENYSHPRESFGNYSHPRVSFGVPI